MMAAKAFRCFLCGAFAIPGPVRGFHREELPASPYPGALQYLHRMLIGGVEVNDGAFNQTSRRSSTLKRTGNWSYPVSDYETGRDAMSTHAYEPQLLESVEDLEDSRYNNLSAPDLTDESVEEALARYYNLSSSELDDEDDEEAFADMHALASGFNLPIPQSENDTAGEDDAEVGIRNEVDAFNTSDASTRIGGASHKAVKEDTPDAAHDANTPRLITDAETVQNNETKVRIRDEIRGLNVSGVTDQDDEAEEESEVRSQIHHHQTRKPDLSSLNSEVTRRYAGPAMEVMKRAVKAAEEQDQEAAKALEKASAMFRKVQDAQDQADAASKKSLDTEAQLVDAKAAALRNITAAQELTVAAAKANMYSQVSSSKLQREAHAAEEVVTSAKRSLDAVRGKLRVAERASAAAQQAAAQAAHNTASAHHDLEAAQDAAEKAEAKRERVEEQVAQASDEMLRVSETYAKAMKAKEEALQLFKTAKQKLTDAAHLGVVLTQRAGNGSSVTPSASSPPSKASD